MVVGVYGVLYAYAARHLDRARLIIAVGLLGKVLGPLGMAASLGTEWPPRAALLCVVNDLVWWLPFGLFLLRDSAAFDWLCRRAAALCCAAHLVALAATPWLWRGSVGAPPERHAWITLHLPWWRLGWAAWMLAAASLVGLLAWWGARLGAVRLATVAVSVAFLGLVCDLSGEGLLALALLDPPAGSATLDHLVRIDRWARWLTAGAANGLYTAGGIVLTVATPDGSLPAWVRGALWLTWLGGAAMSLAAVGGRPQSLALASAVLFLSLLAWSGWMAVSGERWLR
jgi:hypothetical protein